MIPWVLLAVTILASVSMMWSSYWNAYRVFMKNLRFSQTVEHLVIAAAHGKTNEVMGVLQELYKETETGRIGMEAACIAKREELFAILKDEPFLGPSSEQPDAEVQSDGPPSD